MAKYIRSVMSGVVEARQRGVWGTVQALRSGKMGMAQYLVGEDEVGNKYYENPNLPYSKGRWVEYSGYYTRTGVDSMNIPAEWHMWIHRMTDDAPTKIAPEHPIYQADVQGNKTGTKEAYFSSHYPKARNYVGVAKEKVEAWDPKNSTSGPKSEEKDVLDLK